MKYFIDVGANDSCSARIFRKLYDPKCKFKIISMEVEPNFKDRFDDIENCEFMNVAAWTKYGQMEFYRDFYDSRQAGGTLMKNKTSGKLDKENPIIVKTINLSYWIKKNFNKDDTIWLKLDVEGAEYDIIPKMFNEGTLKWIDKLYIEWHWYKLEGMTEKQHNEVFEMVKHIPQEKWHGVENARRILGKNYLKGDIK